jgi:nucleotide-binding universal stress UspA family protein
MYRKLLAAVNEHVNSEIAARYALAVARAAGAGITFCSVREPFHSDNDAARAREAVDRLLQRAAVMGVAAEPLFESGDPAAKIAAMAADRRIDLVFAATRRKDADRRFFTGTVARRLSLKLPCAVALVRVVHLGRIHPRDILIPLKARIDHVPERARFASLLAQAFDSRLFLFHITRPLRTFFHGEIHLTPLQWEENLPPDIRVFIDHLDRQAVSHEKKLAPGSAGKKIGIEAAARRSDLIVMGASTRSLFTAIFRGSPVERVLRDTPCDLIIFKPGRP